MCMVSVRHLKHNGNELQPGYDEEGSSAFVIVILILILTRAYVHNPNWSDEIETEGALSSSNFPSFHHSTIPSFQNNVFFIAIVGL